MLNFNYYNPTRLVFGRGAELKAGEIIAGQDGAGRYILMYGGQSAKRSGLLDRVKESLAEKGIEVVEYGGIKPNPDIDFVRAVKEEYKTKDASAVKGVIAVGGGSVIDTAKALAAGWFHDGDPADFYYGKAAVAKALPVYVVLTIPAAGSESSIRSIQTCDGYKLGIGSELIRPRAAFINPELFFTLPPNQIANGVVDMASHIMERFFSNTEHTDFIDHQIEAALRTIFNFGPKVLADPTNYDNWCQIAMAGTFAHNGVFGLGREEDWACHAMEHAISGWKPEVPHGAGLAVVIPAWMRYASRFKTERFVQFSKKVWGLLDPSEVLLIEKGIKSFEVWCRMMQQPTTLHELGIEDAPFELLAKKAVFPAGTIGHMVKLNEKACLEIFKDMK